MHWCYFYPRRFVVSNWCPEIYRSIYVDRHNDDYLRIAPCCQAESRLEPTQTFDFYTSPYLNSLRQKFSQGQRPTECDRCWGLEKVGQKSRRQGAIEFFNIAESNDTQLESIDNSATWACNLACIMCGPQNSSLWATEEGFDKNQLAVIGRQFQKSNDFIKQLDLSQVKKIHFNGGEPLLNNDQTALLTKLDEQGVLNHVVISYNTNGSVMPSSKLINLWKRAHLVKLFFSIDAIDDAFEYIRWPATWNQVRLNILNMQETLPSNVMFGFNSTVGSYNLFEMSKVWSWFDKNISTNREGDLSDFCWQFANNFDIKYLSQGIKHQAIVQLSTIPAFNGIVNYLKANMQCAENTQWINSLQKLDSKRNTNWQNSLAISQFFKETQC